MISYRELVNALRQAGLTKTRPVVVHAALSTLGDEIHGGPDALIGALCATSAGVLTPAFTYSTMLTPETGPANNGIAYGGEKDRNRLAEFFRIEMPADRMMGLLAEKVRQRPEAARSSHPVLSFAGIHLAAALEAQSIQEPLAPLARLSELDGQVLLIGVDQRVNTSIHLAEARAGRKQFVRWALTPEGVLECPGFGGCSEGFNQAAPLLDPITSRARLGETFLQVIPLRGLLAALSAHLRAYPQALLCTRPDCERCAAVRADPTTLTGVGNEDVASWVS